MNHSATVRKIKPDAVPCRRCVFWTKNHAADGAIGICSRYILHKKTTAGDDTCLDGRAMSFEDLEFLMDIERNVLESPGQPYGLMD
jgi:hypothetical protein